MSNQVSNSGPGVAGFLGLIFITLKLMGYISWSWWWVLAPFWVPIAFVGVLLIVAIWADKV